MAGIGAAGGVAYISGRLILKEVVKVLEGSTPFYHFSTVEGLYVATGFVLVPLENHEDDLTLLEATGLSSITKDGAEESVANALIAAARRQFGVVVCDFNSNVVEAMIKENEHLRRVNKLLKSGWMQSLHNLETLQKTCEEICMDATVDCPESSISLLAHGAAVWADENVWAAMAAVEELSNGVMG